MEPTSRELFEFDDKYVEFTLRILRSYKGATKQATIKINSIYSGACGLLFQPKQTYVVYAFRNDESRQLWTSICTRTMAIKDAAADLRFLRGEPATKEDLIEEHLRRSR